MKIRYDVIIIGAGASGLFCALTAAKRGKRVLLLDHQSEVGKKLAISGGGKCNITNLNITADHYISRNPYFCISALKRFTYKDTLDFIEDLKLEYEERDHGQIFLKNSAKQLISGLLEACWRYQVELRLGQVITHLEKKDDIFFISTESGMIQSDSLVIATGGLSYPVLGASDFGIHIARQFGLKVIDQSPGLVPLSFEEEHHVFFRKLAGIAIEVRIQLANKEFQENMLFTHSGLSGPVILQISSYWRPGASIIIDLLPNLDILAHLKEAKLNEPKLMLRTILSRFFPKRFVALVLEQWFSNQAMNQIKLEALIKIADRLHSWELKPKGTLGYKIAEVTKGGVDTEELSSKTFESKKVSNLHFIGEVMDVIGELGGYNLQWAWSSGYCCGNLI